MADEQKVVTTLEEALDVGYLGTVPDPTPNEAYTVAGVTSSDEAATADRRAAAGQSTIPPDPTADTGDTKKTRRSGS